MPTTIRDLLVKLGVVANTAEVKRFDAALTTTKQTMVGAAVAVAGLVSGLVASTISLANQGDAAAKAGARAGASAEEMQELGFAAEQTGSQVKTVELALRRQAVAADEAAQGTGKAAEMYRRLGVGLSVDGRAKTQVELLESTADAVAGLATEREKLAAVNAIYGRSGAELLPLLNMGAAGIRDLRGQARALGFVIDDETAKATENLNDRLNELRLISVGLRNRIGLALLPVLTRVSERIRDWFFANREVIDQRLDKVVRGVEVAVNTLELALTVLDRRVQEGPGSWGRVFQQIAKALTTAGIIRAFMVLAPLITAAGTALSGLATGAVAIGATIAAALLAVVLLVEDFVVLIQGGESAIGDLLDTFGRKGVFLEKFNNLLQAGSEFLDALGVALDPVISAVADLVEQWQIWETIASLTDVNILGVILTIEQGIEGITNAIKLATLALTDFDSFLSEVLGRVDEYADTARRVVSGALEFTKRPSAVASTIAGPGALIGRSVGRTIAGVPVGMASTLRDVLAERFGPRPEREVVTSSTTITQAGDNITIPTTASADEVVEALERRSQARRTRAMAAARGGVR